jgi:hypothetical protein
VLDRLTRLLWRRSPNLTLQPVVWRDALAAVAGLNRDGADFTWRLPTINELEALVDCAAHSPAWRPTILSQTCRILVVVYHQPVRARLGLAPVSEYGAIGVGQKRFTQFSMWAVATID